ncbi:Glycosyltransferase Family 1 protein [Trametes cinnabarina]|uniref:Glycosyltransferase Family 1 protein n=1 Tax=Pycnoporus cinnabarinus TaxID=5643 RepID=A0A060SSN9_PYCCI|nr:Glycosyltransferase Family 1 protein [Trametes cinnabarina]
MGTEVQKHILLLPVHMWGHARAMALLAGRMVRMRPVVVTLCIADKLWDRTMAEIKSDFSPEEADYLGHIHMLRLWQGDDHVDPAGIRDHFLEIWSNLCAGMSASYQAVDGSTGLVDLKAAPLHAVQGVALEVTEVLHKQRTDPRRPLNLHLYLWVPVFTDLLVTLFRTNPVPIVKAFQDQQNISWEDACFAVFSTKHGHVIESPWLPPMYDYGFEPQGFTFPKEFLSRIVVRTVDSLHWADGLITLDALDYHPEGSRAFKEYMSELGRECHYAGPLISASHSVPPETDAQGAAESMAFMERQLRECGERSVVYVSFGSLLWPQDPKKLATALDFLIEQQIPFIMPRPSPVAKLSEDVLQRLTNNSAVYLGDWLPQQALLDHLAMGWCITHGGHNTVLECIHAGTPMIFWPITVDQVLNAVHLTYNVNMAYELIEVRTGVGAGPIYRTGKAPVGTLDAVRDELREVLARAIGEDGERKRQQMLGLRRTLAAAWTEDGAARREVGHFLDHVLALPTSSLFPI